MRPVYQQIGKYLGNVQGRRGGFITRCCCCWLLLCSVMLLLCVRCVLAAQISATTADRRALHARGKYLPITYLFYYQVRKSGSYNIIRIGGGSITYFYFQVPTSKRVTTLEGATQAPSLPVPGTSTITITMIMMQAVGATTQKYQILGMHYLLTKQKQHVGVYRQ